MLKCLKVCRIKVVPISHKEAYFKAFVIKQYLNSDEQIKKCDELVL